MTIGIIIIFYNNENDLNKDVFSNLIHQSKHTPLCLVNNGSLDETLEVLKFFNEEFQSNLTIVDIKKNKGNDLAIKAGARYLSSNENLNYIGYLNLDLFLNLDAINKFIKTLKDNKELIINYNTKRIENRQYQRKWFRNLFSITNFLDFSSIEFQINL
jgi:hypothetical protein